MVKPTKLIFLAGGSFNPPTLMHLRLFEIARDAFHEHDGYEVVGGIISPVHDSYRKQKPDLVAAAHRCAMANLSVQSSDWIRVSEWECNERTQWTSTRNLLRYHQHHIDTILNGSGTSRRNIGATHPSWMPPDIQKHHGDKVQVKLLCGADLLESFAIPGLWADDDIEAILSAHGIVVVTRSGNNPEQFISQSDLLTKYKWNIDVVTNCVPNEISSTLARRHLRCGLSVKYLLDDCVIEYIRQHRLYTHDLLKYSSSNTTNRCCCSTSRMQSSNYGYDSDNKNSQQVKLDPKEQRCCTIEAQQNDGRNRQHRH